MRLSDFYDARVIYGIPLVAASLFFTGCAVRPADQSAALLESPVQTDSAQALQRMLQSKDSNKTSWQLLAIRALLREGKNQQATDLFSQLLPKLDDAQQQERSLLAVELKLAQNDFTAAQTLLAKINPADLKGTQAERPGAGGGAGGVSKNTLLPPLPGADKAGHRLPAPRSAAALACCHAGL